MLSCEFNMIPKYRRE